MNSEITKNDIVNESAIDVLAIKKMLKEGTSSILKDILKESVQNELRNIITEDKEEEDTTDTEVSVSDETPEGSEEVSVDSTETEATPESDDTASAVDSEGGEDELAPFEKFKVDDETYDLTNASEDEFIKIYKLLDDDTQISISQDGNTTTIKDPETGSEYMIVNNGGAGAATSEPETDLSAELSTDGTDDILNIDASPEEETMYEISESVLRKIIALTEDNLGYTTKYQEKTAMTTGGVAEPGKNVNDWDKGVPTSGDDTRRYGNPDKKADPFKGGVKEEAEGEEDMLLDEEDQMDENLTRTKSQLRMRASKLSEPQIDATNGVRVDNVRDGAKLEEALKKINKLQEHCETYKNTIVVLKNMLQESAISNLKLAKITNLFTENTTTPSEKVNIVKRFQNEAKTIEDVEKLYENVKTDLKNNKVQITENIKVKETVIYENKDNKDVQGIKSLMQRMK